MPANAPHGGRRSRQAVIAVTLGAALSGCTYTTVYGTLGQGVPPRVSRLQVTAEHSCSGPLRSYNYKMCCEVQAPIHGALLRTTDLQAFVREHGRSGRIRTVGARHSSNKQICIESKSEKVLQLTNMRHDPNYAPVFVYQELGADDRLVDIADVDASLTLGELNAMLSSQGYTLGFHNVFFRGVTVAGALATGAHGSNMRKSSVLSSRLRGLRLIDADGDLRVLTPENTIAAPDLWPALQTHMGQLGIMTRVRLQVERDFWAHVREDHGYEGRLMTDAGPRKVLQGCEWGQIVWFPRAHRYISQCGVRSARSGDPTTNLWENGLLRPYASPRNTNIVKEFMQRRRANDRCWLEDVVYVHRARQHTLMQRADRGVDAREHRWSDEAIGRPHLLTTSEVSPYQDRIPQFDFEVAIPERHAALAIDEASRWIKQHFMCLPLIGVFLRFSQPGDTGLVAHSQQYTQETSGGSASRPRPEPVVFFEFVVYAPGEHQVEDPEDRHFTAYRDLAELLVTKYGGRAHWGKNYEHIFLKQRGSAPEYAKRLQRFARVARCMDPRGVFSTGFARRVGLREDVKTMDNCGAIQAAGRMPATDERAVN